MRRITFCLIVIAFVSACTQKAEPTLQSTPTFEQLAKESLSKIDGQLKVPGIKAEVQILRDEWGVPHIFAQNLDDLFFAQGFVIAQDRLWQMEIWRRTGEGRVAELVGAAGVPHDKLFRLLKYRGPFDDSEWNSYHPEGKRIFAAYAAGVNAYIASVGDNLPVEFKLIGLKPEPWTPEQLLLRARVSDAISDARSELRLARSVAQLGVREAGRRMLTEPADDLRIPDGLDIALISEDVLKALDGDMYGNIPRPQLLPQFRNQPGAKASVDMGVPETSPGSNNWAIGGQLSATGKGIMVDDPHRQVTNPAHRYVIHLNAPGWNVIGATEAPLAGVIRGHNGRVAWGRTATETDQADVYVETVNPANPNEVMWNGKWEPMKIISEEIAVKGESPRKVEMKFSRHGPIFFEDRQNHRAYALRSQLQEPGTAEYIGGLRMDQASSAKDCLTNADFMPTPPTNLVCADAEGNVAFRVAIFAPKRAGWTGRLPVPGTGEFEWAAERRKDLPSEFNPARGFIATANNRTQPPDFNPPYAYVPRAAEYRRYDRIMEMIKAGGSGDGKRFTIDDMVRMLRDSLNTEAVESLKYFRGWKDSGEIEVGRSMIDGWDGVMDKNSAAAALYMSWRRKVNIDAVRNAKSPAEQRPFVSAGLRMAIEELKKTQGTDQERLTTSTWRWGRMNRSEFPHYIVGAYDVPAVERQGGAGTVNAIGAVYRLITNFAEPDKSLVTIGPGMSGQPGSPFYSNLIEMWGKNEFFPALYSRGAIDAKVKHRLVLTP